jgi:DNA-binding NarL/FixJ family response regulator
MRILLSEECPIYREGIKFVLENEGNCVNNAISRQDFTNLFSSDYDVIIFDLDMLGSLAIDLAKQIDAWMTYSLNKRCKLVATYKDGFAYYLAHLFDAGLKKPFTKEKLLKVINGDKTNDERFNNQRNIGNTGGFYEHRVV